MCIRDRQDSFENGPEDDCDQDVAAQEPGGHFQDITFGGDWEASALSKKYTKAPTTIDALKRMKPPRWVEL